MHPLGLNPSAEAAVTGAGSGGREGPRITAGGIFRGRLFLFDSVPSTNRWAMEHLAELRHGDVIRGRRQTAGRGRFERQWLSPSDRGLALSVVLRLPPGQDRLAAMSGAAAALATADTLESNGIPAKLKWPNDVLSNGRKIAGILAERDATTGLLVVGVGLNVNCTPRDFQGSRLLFPATSMRIVARAPFEANRVCRGFLRHFESVWKAVVEEGSGFIREEWQKRDALAGQEIRVQHCSVTEVGLYKGTDENGRLLLETRDGQTRSYWSGDVSIGAGRLTEREPSLRRAPRWTPPLPREHSRSS